MRVTDPIADMLTRIRNASRAGHRMVDIPSSKLKWDIARILHDLGFISRYTLIEDNKQNIIRIRLRYTPEGESVITNLQRISRPGLRRYFDTDEIRATRRRLGTYVFSTSKGVLAGDDAVKQKVGGEALFKVW